MSIIPEGKSKARYINGMFTDLSERYDTASAAVSFKKKNSWMEFAASLVDGSGAQILDVCCGTGELSFRLARKSSGRVVAMDFCEGMVNQATKKFGDDDKLSFGIADVENLPFPDESFTCVTVSFALRNVTSIERAISEMVRVVKKGGKVIILDLGKPRSPVFRQLYYFYFYRLSPIIGRFFAVKKGNYAYDYLPHSLTYFPAQDGLKKIMEDIGLAQVEVHDLTMGIAAVHVGTKAG